MSTSNLDRFIVAHQRDYHIALNEIKSGHKVTHWIWYIFPQIIGLGVSSTSKYYAINNLQEAKDFLSNPILGANLIEISKVLLELTSNDATEVFGTPDDMKLRSSMTLFSIANPSCMVFNDVINKFFNGQKDERTIAILRKIELESIKD